MKHKRLGKGLEALIPPAGEVETNLGRESLSEVDVSLIHSNPFQPRLEFNRNQLDELKQSIIENGVIQPITVRAVGDEYELIAGERRLRAVQEVGFSKIPAYVIEVSSDDQMLEMALVENIQREDLNPIDLAKAYQRLQKEYGMTQEAVARKVGKDRATVANVIRLLKLPAKIQESIKNEEISMGHARALMGLPDSNLQMAMWKKIIKNSWSVRKVEDAVREALDVKEKIQEPELKQRRDPHLLEMEDRLRQIFGTQAHVRPLGKGGKVEIHYYSSGDLVRIMELFEQIGI
jgi:ParB family chromosome partitioning protein